MLIQALAMVLAIAHAQPLVAQQAPEGPSKARVDGQLKNSSNKAPAPTPAAQVNPGAAQNDKESASKQKEHATDNPVRITELPPASVKRDWIDRISIVFTGILTLVGMAGVCAAYRTL